MAAHKYWRATMLTTLSDTLEMGQFQLYAAGVRVDASAVLTSDRPPSSGSLANLKDGTSTAGAYWSSLGGEVVLNWAFPTAVDVDAVRLGCRTSSTRFPTSGALLGSADFVPAGLVSVRGFGSVKFVPGSMLEPSVLRGPNVYPRFIPTSFDHSGLGGRGLITDTVKTKALPTNVPTYCKVRLIRDIDSKLVRETWTDPITGVYRFDGFDESFTYSVIATHPTGAFRAVIADRLTPGLMP